MKLAKTLLPDSFPSVILIEGQHAWPLESSGPMLLALRDVLEAADPAAFVHQHVDRNAAPLDVARLRLLPPIDQQEVWAAGVTYKRSKAARMEESAGAARFYDLVYEAPRPELFFKASPHRVVGPGQGVRIRSDATWSVPEPELALVLNSRLKIVGYTIGNDMSSRDIEGENPLYLPQAKVYDASCALGPCITLASAMPPREQIGIQLNICRNSEVVFTGKTDLGQLNRTFEDLVSWLGRDNLFPDGVILLTGTGIVPGNDFTLLPGDIVEIRIDGIGTLINPVIQFGA
ncbi:MAG TPA: fumarylacetoacetate hydrolase family protein [Pirellulales bacterium]|jgi:2-dehydro-3-deoxy-D-arabinonate dehydratase|nr:fumarylacetoacetate hydrolase family protein [Pirellulales bacterium]